MSRGGMITHPFRKLSGFAFICEQKCESRGKVKIRTGREGAIFYPYPPGKNSRVRYRGPRYLLLHTTGASRRGRRSYSGVKDQTKLKNVAAKPNRRTAAENPDAQPSSSSSRGEILRTLPAVPVPATLGEALLLHIFYRVGR